jgi:hypothetical protein
MPSFNEPSTSYDSIFPLSNCMLAVPDILLLSIVSVHVPWLPVIPEVPTSVTYQILPAARAGALMATKIAAAFRAHFIILSPHFDESSHPRRIWSRELAWLARRRPKGAYPAKLRRIADGASRPPSALPFPLLNGARPRPIWTAENHRPSCEARLERNGWRNVCEMRGSGAVWRFGETKPVLRCKSSGRYRVSRAGFQPDRGQRNGNLTFRRRGA